LKFIRVNKSGVSMDSCIQIYSYEKRFFVIYIWQWKILPIKIGEYLKITLRIIWSTPDIQISTSLIGLTFYTTILTINSHELKNWSLLEYWSDSHGFSKLVIKSQNACKYIFEFSCGNTKWYIFIYFLEIWPYAIKKI
jgi:hypothetical protein